MISQWQAQYNALMRARCEPCVGGGVLDDAEPGTAFYSTWTCPTCGGRGFAPQPKQHQRPPEIEQVVSG